MRHYTLTWPREVGDTEQPWRVRFTYEPETRASRRAPAEGGEVEIEEAWMIRVVGRVALVPVSNAMDYQEWRTVAAIADAELAEVERRCLEHAMEDDSHEPEFRKREDRDDR